jgi:hypothetical protein
VQADHAPAVLRDRRVVRLHDGRIVEDRAQAAA